MAEKKIIKKVTLELNEVQAGIVLAALEEWFRLRMGQSYDLANDLALMGFKHDKDHPELFDAAMVKRDSLNSVIKALFNIAWPHYGTPGKVEDRTHIASDIWSVLRSELWKVKSPDYWGVAGGRPIQMGPEPLPVVTIETGVQQHDD